MTDFLCSSFTNISALTPSAISAIFCSSCSSFAWLLSATLHDSLTSWWRYMISWAILVSYRRRLISSHGFGCGNTTPTQPCRRSSGCKLCLWCRKANLPSPFRIFRLNHVILTTTFPEQTHDHVYAFFFSNKFTIPRSRLFDLGCLF